MERIARGKRDTAPARCDIMHYVPPVFVVACDQAPLELLLLYYPNTELSLPYARKSRLHRVLPPVARVR